MSNLRQSRAPVSEFIVQLPFLAVMVICYYCEDACHNHAHFIVTVSQHPGVLTVNGSLLSSDVQTQREELQVNLYSFEGGAGNVSSHLSNCDNRSCHGQAGEQSRAPKITSIANSYVLASLSFICVLFHVCALYPFLLVSSILHSFIQGLYTFCHFHLL